MALAFERLGIFVFAQNIFIQLHVAAKEILKPGFDPLSILQHFLGDVVRIDVDADPANYSEILAFNGD